jgi:hypothetical protein
MMYDIGTSDEGSKKENVGGKPKGMVEALLLPLDCLTLKMKAV